MLVKVLLNLYGGISEGREKFRFIKELCILGIVDNYRISSQEYNISHSITPTWVLILFPLGLLG
ncbi:hypothetical protein HCUR_00806 [Holospora curviuscula]|uniref:Uncharacterized protein n=1 Tax=Holospora curviuscula TaxID=1082868 RepID=A0A2S5R8Z2_9PROT|nr:hypothetical protein HCUR_00806 [Holospora curviuscula]